MESSLNIKQIYTCNPLRNFTYIIHDHKEAYCIDPYEAKEITDYLEEMELNLVAIINTHEHGDHTYGNQKLVEATKVPIWTHRDAVSKIENASRALKDGEIISFDSKNFIKVLDTPGHTMSHICLLVFQDNKELAVITGDCVFNGGVGNCSNGGCPETLYETVKILLGTLPDHTIIYPGHDYLYNNLGFTLSLEPDHKLAIDLKNEYPESNQKFIKSDLAIEKKINLFFRTEEKEIQNKILKGNSQELKNSNEAPSKKAFIQLRQLRNKW